MNIRFEKNFINLLLICVSSSGLFACSSGGSDSSNAGRGDFSSTSKTSLTINITDAPVDNAEEVWVQFTGVTIKPADGDKIEFIFDSAKNIDLLSLQGTDFTSLLDNVTISAGSYEWVRLAVNANNDGVVDSYIKLYDGSIHELSIPSGSQTGLKIVTMFKATTNKPLNMTIDFDLRKSVVMNNGNYSLTPALRMINNEETGNLSGTIDSSLLTATDCTDSDPNTANAVYLYEGTDTIPVDINNQPTELVTSAGLQLSPTSGEYEYMIGYVLAGDYTLAFTCQADLDDPKFKDDINFSFYENVTIIVASEIGSNVVR